ncbi:hypothetical protein GCK72_021604 [Caenorhabditis remanei]|uniref:DUF4781 domain-containing protein n=1 Tax=Caenorhabditis remanei TaxID=31234 RepID=A0A6A5GKA4_CAERE|nr:hypothetical protein GCK72_021604 [Caenorhabditis remanei]KAF1755036.1 hypothetical protein GCK72_021604 [Caenorhabditis remanei]
MEVFNAVKKTVLSIISDAVDSETYLEDLTAIGGLIKPEVVATSFQLMERGKVRELTTPRSEIRQKPRVFEDFQEKPIFDWRSEWELRRPKRKKASENFRHLQRSFVEVEHAKRKESLQFFYPQVHYCPCRYFQVSVLERQVDWICVHLLAYYFSRSFGKMEKIECKIEIIEDGKVTEIRKDTVSIAAEDVTSDSSILNHISPQKRVEKQIYFVRKMPPRNEIIEEQAGPSSSNILIKEPKAEPIELNKSPNRASNKMRVSRRLNWSNRRNRQLIALQQCQTVNKVVKDELIEVKEEPIDDYEQECNSYQRATSLPVNSHPRLKSINPTWTEDVPKVDIPVFKTEKPTSVDEPPVDRIFLGAEEPMKDVPDNKIEEISRIAQSTVKRFTKSQLLPFGKRPALILQDGEVMNREARSRSVVLIDEVEEPKEEGQSEDELELDILKLIDSKKAKLYESVRQKQAKAQKLIFNELRVTEYMNSEIFKKSIKPPDDSSSFQKVVKAPHALSKYPAYSDSLSRSSSLLFKNLERVQEMKRKEKYGTIWDRNYKAPKKRDHSPVQFKYPILPKRKEVQLTYLASETIEMLEISWKGKTGKVPEFIQCHLCNGTMRFGVRSRRFRGEVREHPTYRCFRKGCQTYCSVKKVVNMNHWEAIPDDPKEFIIKEVGKLKSKPPEIVASNDKDSEIRAKRVTRNKLDYLSKDFICGSSASEIARFDDEDDEERLGETIGYWYTTESSESSEEPMGEDAEKEDDYSDHVEAGMPFPTISCSKRETTPFTGRSFTGRSLCFNLSICLMFFITMGNTVSGEYLSSWDDEDVQKWKKTARNMQQCTYLQFEGSQFHDLTDLTVELRVTKICFAIYGPPTKAAETLEQAYSKDQREFGMKCYEKIREVWREAPEKRMKLGFIFVFCKEGEKEYQVPLFRLLWEKKNGQDTNRYIDTSLRVYDGFSDWKNNNHMPMMKYCHPKKLFYTCHSEWEYQFDPDEEVAVGFNTSPACDLSARIGKSADVIVTTVGMTVGVLSLVTPAGFISGPILLSVGLGSAGWGVSRATQRLIDKATHGESLTDQESVLLWLSIIAAPLNLLNGFVGAKLASGAAAGKIFSQTQRILATLLMWTVLSVDSFSFLMNLTNLVEKAINGKLTTLDVLQFSVSTLFFANMLIQPKTANGIIKKAQQQRIQDLINNMTDADAKAAFKEYLEANKGDGGIGDGAKLVRDLNKIEDLNAFFKSASGFKDVKIGAQYTESTQSGTPKVYKLEKLKACLGGKDYKDHQHLGQLDDRQIGRLNKVFGGAAKYDEHVVNFATKIANEMKMSNNPDGFMSLVEMVAAQAKLDPNFPQTGNVQQFCAGIQQDLSAIREMGNQFTFSDEFKALYHYRKHGDEFMRMCTPDFYLGELPAQIQQQGQLADVCKVTSMLPNGSTEVFTRKTYFCDNDSILVMIENGDLKNISTMYKKPNSWTEYTQRFQNCFSPDSDFSKLAFVAGLDAIQLQLRSSSFFFKDQNDFSKDPNYEKYKIMIEILAEDIANCMEHDDDK